MADWIQVTCSGGGNCSHVACTLQDMAGFTHGRCVFHLHIYLELRVPAVGECRNLLGGDTADQWLADCLVAELTSGPEPVDKVQVTQTQSYTEWDNGQASASVQALTFSAVGQAYVFTEQYHDRLFKIVSAYFWQVLNNGKTEGMNKNVNKCGQICDQIQITLKNGQKLPCLSRSAIEEPSTETRSQLQCQNEASASPRFGPLKTCLILMSILVLGLGDILSKQ